MAKSKAALFLEACEKGDLSTINEYKGTKFKLSSKSTSKDFDNRFEQALHLASKTKNELAVVTALSSFEEDINELVSEFTISKLASSSRIESLDILISNGLNVGRKSENYKYKTVFDRLFRESLSYSRIEPLAYLISKFNYNWLSNNKICSSICDPNNSDVFSFAEIGLQSKLNGFKSLYDIFFKEAILNKDIENLSTLLSAFKIENVNLHDLVRIIVHETEIIESIEPLLRKNDTYLNNFNCEFTNFYDLMIKSGVTAEDIINIVNLN